IPMSVHLSPAWVCATDLDPIRTIQVKRELLPLLLEPNTVIAFDHDTQLPLARVQTDGKRYTAAPAEQSISSSPMGGE
ncbi:MAG: hypothetical protein V3T31_04260, partial [candidate division Zixibacteria bacterium]